MAARRIGVRCRDLLGDHVDVGAADPRRRARKILVDDVLVEADTFEDLGAAVALQRRDAHLGHHLEDALFDGLDIIGGGRWNVQTRADRQRAIICASGFEGQVRIDGPGAVAEQTAEVMDLARLAGFDHEAAAGAQAFADQVVVHAGRCQQGRNRCLPFVGPAIG